METRLEKLIAEALAMPPADRAAFAQLLLESLPAEVSDGGAWEREIKCRVANIKNGITQLIPIDDALAQMRMQTGIHRK
jgi:hypothetical protein